MSQLRAIANRLLSNASSAYLPSGHICEMILPRVFSKESTGTLAKYGTNHLRIERSIKGGRGAYRRVEAIARSTSDFKIDGHGLEGLVTAEDYRNVQEPYKAEEDEVMGLTSLIYIEKEKLFADALLSTSNITQNVTLSGVQQFSDYNNSEPLARFSTARSTVRNASGMAPNAAVMDWQTADKLRYHPELLDALGYKENRPGGLQAAELASAMGVQKILIGNVMYESAREGQTSSLAAVWGKDILFAVLPDSANRYQVSLGYQVNFDGKPQRQVWKYAVNNPPESTGILVEDNYDIFISNATAGYLIKAAIA